MPWLERCPAVSIRPWLCLVGWLAASGTSAGQWQAAGYLGGAHTANSDLLLRQPSLGTNLLFEDVSFRGDSFATPLYYGVRGGYFLRPRWAAEIEFVHLKVFANVNRPARISGTLNGSPYHARQPVETIVERFSISHGVNLLMANVVFRQPVWRSPFGRGRLTVTARFGVGGTIPHPETTVQGEANEHYQWGSFAMQSAGGVELRLWRGLHWMGEYKYTRTRQKVDVFSGTATVRLSSHHLVTGPAVRF